MVIDLPARSRAAPGRTTECAIGLWVRACGMANGMRPRVRLMGLPAGGRAGEREGSRVGERRERRVCVSRLLGRVPECCERCVCAGAAARVLEGLLSAAD